MSNRQHRGLFSLKQNAAHNLVTEPNVLTQTRGQDGDASMKAEVTTIFNFLVPSDSDPCPWLQAKRRQRGFCGMKL